VKARKKCLSWPWRMAEGMWRSGEELKSSMKEVAGNWKKSREKGLLDWLVKP